MNKIENVLPIFVYEKIKGLTVIKSVERDRTICREVVFRVTHPRDSIEVSEILNQYLQDQSAICLTPPPPTTQG